MRIARLPVALTPVLVAKALCLLYLGVLYWLLLTAGPRLLVPSRFGNLLPWNEIFAIGHLFCFTLLTALTFLSQWKMPSWSILLLLVIAALGTELLQGLVPTRTPEMADCLLNLAGIGLGGGFYWGVARLLRSGVLRYTR